MRTGEGQRKKKKEKKEQVWSLSLSLSLSDDFFNEKSERVKKGSALPVDEVPPGVGRRGAAVGFLHREEKCEKGAGIAPLLWPGGVKDLGSFFLFFFIFYFF